MRKVVLLHGIGGAVEVEPALALLNDHLGSRGYPRVSVDDVIAVDYEAILEGLSEEAPTPLSARVGPSDGERTRAARTNYVARAARIRSRLDRTQDDLDLLLHRIPEPLADAAIHLPQLHQVKRYAASAAVREAVWRAVLAELPPSGEIVLVGHSLGTVIAVDLIAHLPEEVSVHALVTLASPLGFVPGLRRRSDLMRRDSGFPFDRVLSWTNIYGVWDPVTGGRGLAHEYRWASDASIRAAGHGLREYLNHPLTLEVLEEALFATYLPEPVTDEVDRQLAGVWLPQLLAFAWAQRIGEAMPSAKESERRQLLAARSELARRSIAGYRTQVAELDRERQAAGDVVDLGDAAHFEVLRQHPTQADLVDRPGLLLRGRLSDVELLTWLVPAVRAWPVAPFGAGAKASPKIRKQALIGLLAQVRTSRAADRLVDSDERLADLLLETIHKAEQDMGPERSAALLGLALAGVGAATLVAIPLTFGASIPAGLSGAAALTAGLAAFGPGGMAGGIATVALLTGGGVGVAAVGTALGITEESGHGRRLRDRDLARNSREIRQQLVALPPAALKETLISLLAVIRLESALAGADPSPRYSMAMEACDRLRAEARLHEELAPGGSSNLSGLAGLSRR